jgi:prepilin-type N-terminal cleavage/methylation domain-containing protein
MKFSINPVNTEVNQKGFSLIELLVVIVIIMLLGTISVVALNDQRAKSRDSQRISDIRQIRTALEFYRSDEGEYPIVNEPLLLGPAGALKLCAKSNGGLVFAETVCQPETTYMADISGDPLGNRKYYYTGTKDGFDISFSTEKPSSLGSAANYHAHSQTIDTQAGNK